MAFKKSNFMDNSIDDELRLFISEAKRLSERSFYQYFQSGEEVIFSDIFPENGPSLEQLESYLLHFRKFVQKNDRVCIDRINQYVCEFVNDHPTIRDDWKDLYTTFQGLLEAKALTGRVGVNAPEVPDLSLRDLFKSRTFGDLSHLDPKKRQLHEKLSANPQLDAMYRFEYYGLLAEVGELIGDLKANYHSSVGCVSAQQNASPTISKMMRCPSGQHILGWIGMIFYREIPCRNVQSLRGDSFTLRSHRCGQTMVTIGSK
jgi:hypothetical protein